MAALLLIVAGVTVFSWDSLANAEAGEWRGDLLFVLVAIMWASFGVMTKRWTVDPIQGTATVCVLSLFNLPLWAPYLSNDLWHVSVFAIALQAIYQGLVVGVLGLFLYTRCVALLGPVGAALFLPLVPNIASIGGAFALSEWSSTLEIIGMVVVVTGMGLALRTKRPR